MKTTKVSLSMAIIMVAGCLLFTNCRKKEKTVAQEPDNEQSSASDNTMSENIDNDILSMGSQLSENSGTFTTFRTMEAAEVLMLAGNCATINAAYTNSVISSATVNFGAACTSTADGRTRSGILYFDFSGSIPPAKYYRNPGFKMVITSSNYVVDGNQISVNKTVTNTTPGGIPTGPNPGTNLTWSISANLTIVKANNGGTITWSCNRTKELINTDDPTCYYGQTSAINWTKAKIRLSGNATGTNAKGESYTATAAYLTRDFTCVPDITKPHRHPFVSGTIDYTPGTRATRRIDYGNGSCDFNATVTINGQTFTLTLQ